jgi:hypothetical protein
MRLIAAFLIFFSFDLFSASREIGNSTLQFVGKIKFPNHSCSGFIVKHGLLVTAKHCFNHFDINPDNFNPKGTSVTFPGNKSKVVINSIDKLIFDSGENDIAYLTYDPSQTLDLINLGDFKISKDIDFDLDIFRAGFSGEETYSSDRILTQGCKFNKKKGHFPAMVTDPGYEGLLFDTECPAWFGDSGGPVITLQEGKLVIVGILSHTFEVDFAGEIPPESIERDSFGRYVKTSIVSPFSEALDIWNLLDS